MFIYIYVTNNNNNNNNNNNKFAKPMPEFNKIMSTEKTKIMPFFKNPIPIKINCWI